MASRDPTPDCTESLSGDAPEVLALLEREGDAQLRQLRSSDLEFVRVLEDVIELLVAKGVISFTDLPDAAREKLMSRKSLRRQVNSVDLIGEQDDVGLI
ncbi:MAG TPA: tryptophan synthase subunit beta like protein [Modicisalibacter sp.]|nr:tryptophan synthase subunit beta like protein [Modicisalibacter sp.]